MSVGVCVYVCVCVCVFMCACVSVCLCTYICMCVNMDIYHRHRTTGIGVDAASSVRGAGATETASVGNIVLRVAVARARLCVHVGTEELVDWLYGVVGPSDAAIALLAATLRQHAIDGIMMRSACFLVWATARWSCS